MVNACPVPSSRVKQIGIRLPLHLSDQLAAIARREHNGVSAVCRRLLARALAHEAGGDIPREAA